MEISHYISSVTIGLLLAKITITGWLPLVYYAMQRTLCSEGRGPQRRASHVGKDRRSTGKVPSQPGRGDVGPLTHVQAQRRGPLPA